MDLAERAAELLGRQHRRFVVAEVREGVVRSAAHGLPEDADLEIGSVSKGLTGLLYAEALARGEVRTTTRLGELLEVPGQVAPITLEALSTHTSGLPRLDPGTRAVRGSWELLRSGTNPYGETLAELLSRLDAVRVRPRGRARYSNLGFMLLGHAVAVAAGTSYTDLLAGRLAKPLGLTSAYVPASPAELGASAIYGVGRYGGWREAWTGESLGPAGGVRMSAADLARLLGALLDGTAPGIAALEPVRSFRGPVHIGAAWLVMPMKGRTLTWHNGGTGGFRSFVGLDRAAGTGVAVVSACSRTVDRAGFRLLTD